MDDNRHGPKTAVIFGAGPGLGTSLAFKLGREGYRVALVARREAPLNALVADLAQEGIEAVAFPADLTKLDTLAPLVAQIEARLGGVSVAVYAPVPAGLGFVNAVDLDAKTLQDMMNLFTLAPVELGKALLVGMQERRDGALVYVGGASAIINSPGFSGPGQAMAAARNYFHSLNAEGKEKGFYAGTVFIGGMVANSVGHQAMVASGYPITFPVISPDDIAEAIWQMITQRDRIEVILPPDASLPTV